MNAPTPETDQLRDLRENHIHRANEGDIWELCESLERDRNEAREVARAWRDNWLNGASMSMLAGSKLPWENDQHQATASTKL